MKLTHFSFALVAFFLSIALVSAAGVHLVQNAIPNAVHNQDVTVSLNLSNTDTTAYTALDWTGSQATGATVKQLSSVTSIDAGETKEVKFVLAVPQYAVGSVSATFQVKNGTAVTPLATRTLTIPVSNTPSLSASLISAPASNQNGTLNVTNTGNVKLNNVELTASGPATVVFSANRFGLSQGESRAVTVSLTDIGSLAIGSNTMALTAKDSVETSAQATSSFSLAKSFCRSGDVGKNLSISNVDITNEGRGDEDDWRPLDTLKVEVRVDNDGNDKIKDVTLELGFFDSTGKNVVNKLDFENKDDKKITLGDINDGNDEVDTFVFTVPGDFDTGNYKVAVKAYSKKTGEDFECTDRSSELDNTVFESVQVEREDDEGKFIAFDNVQLSSTSVTCSETVTLSTDVFNIGEDDEDRVKVMLSNRDLKLDLSQELINLDVGSKKSVTFTFQVPDGLADKSHTLDLSASYDYNNGVYRESLDEPKKIILKVFGCTVTQQPGSQQGPAIVSATLDSEVVAGKPLVVKATIRNTGTQPVTYVVNAKGYESWATLDSISERILSLKPGESKNLTFNFKAGKTASDEQTFTIELSDGSSIVQSQQITVAFPESKASLSLFGGENSQFIWIFVIVNIILIVVIVIVAVRLARR